MLKLCQHTADSYIQGFSALTTPNKISSTPHHMSRRLPPVSQTFSGAHNQGLARRIPANAGGGGFSIANVVSA